VTLCWTPLDFLRVSSVIWIDSYCCSFKCYPSILPCRYPTCEEGGPHHWWARWRDASRMRRQWPPHRADVNFTDTFQGQMNKKLNWFVNLLTKWCGRLRLSAFNTLIVLFITRIWSIIIIRVYHSWCNKGNLLCYDSLNTFRSDLYAVIKAILVLLLPIPFSSTIFSMRLMNFFVSVNFINVICARFSYKILSPKNTKVKHN